MEQQLVIPSMEGQICKIINPLPDENPEDVYILSEDPTPYNLNDNIYVTNLKELQRNIDRPLFVSIKAIKKSDLTVVADSLTEYIKAWN